LTLDRSRFGISLPAILALALITWSSAMAWRFCTIPTPTAYRDRALDPRAPCGSASRHLLLDHARAPWVAHE